MILYDIVSLLLLYCFIVVIAIIIIIHCYLMAFCNSWKGDSLVKARLEFLFGIENIICYITSIVTKLTGGGDG